MNTPETTGNRSQHVTLGCGTLILIGFVVMFFSRPGMRDLEWEVHHLRSEVGELKKSIEAQSTEIKALRDNLDRGRGNE